MKASLFFLVCAFLTQDVYGRKIKHNGKVKDNKIVGGYNATIEEFPYQVLLFVQKNGELLQCGGSIISRNYILTAAHCLAGITLVYVKMGSTTPALDENTILATNFTQHPKYNSSTYNNDVGVVSVDTPIEIDGVTTKIVRLPRRGTPVKAGRIVTVSGWGATSENGEVSESLMAVDVPVVGNEECRKSYTKLTDRMFCAGVPEGGKDSCQGDSGGPAVLKKSGTQVGIVSFGIGCARPGYPGVYTKVSSVRDWIKSVTGV